MAQTGYTPILIYSSSTTTNAPAAGSLTNSTLGSELAINITDGKLFYKDNANNVQVIAWKTTPTTAGGTGLTSYTAGDLLYYASGTTLTKLGIGSAYQALQVNAGGTAPSWQASATSTLTAQGDLLYASAANTLARLAKNTSATRYLSNTGSSNNPAWAQIDLTNGVTGTLPTGNGGTGLTSFTANGVVYASSTSALATGSALVFDGSRLGIGVSPSYALEVAVGTSGQQSLANFRTANATAANNAGIQIFATPSATATSRSVQAIWDADGANSSGGDYFVMAKNGNDGTMDLFQYSNASIRFGANFTGRGVVDMTLFPSGGVSIGNTTDPGATNLSVSGNVVIATSGKGIDFSATAGTGTSELLADYEEGTWTPTITGSTSAGTGTYTTQIGRYVKVGSMVYCQAYILWTNHTGTGNLWLTGLPYTLFATTDNHPSGSIGLLANVALTAGNIATTYGSPNTTRFNLVQYPTGGGAASSVPIDTAGEIIYSVCYYAN